MNIQPTTETEIERRLSREEACQYLDEVWGIQRKPSTLAAYATNGGGPEFEMDGRFPKYRPSSLDRFAKERLGHPVSSTAEHKTVNTGAR